MRKVVQPASVVEIQMGQHDVPHIAWVQPEPLYLPDCCHFLAQVRLDQGQKKSTQARTWLGHIAQAETGIDQHQPGAGSHQQAMATQMAAIQHAWRTTIHEMAAQRTGGDAVR